MTILSKKQMSEEDLKLNYITPALLSGWSDHITMETKITDGKINLRGNMAVRGFVRVLLHISQTPKENERNLRSPQKMSDIYIYYRRKSCLTLIKLWQIRICLISFKKEKKQRKKINQIVKKMVGSSSG